MNDSSCSAQPRSAPPKEIHLWGKKKQLRPFEDVAHDPDRFNMVKISRVTFLSVFNVRVVLTKPK